jgi:hypothetical protein
MENFVFKDEVSALRKGDLQGLNQKQATTVLALNGKQVSTVKKIKKEKPVRKEKVVNKNKKVQEPVVLNLEVGSPFVTVS